MYITTNEMINKLHGPNVHRLCLWSFKVQAMLKITYHPKHGPIIYMYM